MITFAFFTVLLITVVNTLNYSITPGYKPSLKQAPTMVVSAHKEILVCFLGSNLHIHPWLGRIALIPLQLVVIHINTLRMFKKSCIPSVQFKEGCAGYGSRSGGVLSGIQEHCHIITVNCVVPCNVIKNRNDITPANI